MLCVSTLSTGQLMLFHRYPQPVAVKTLITTTDVTTTTQDATAAIAEISVSHW